MSKQACDEQGAAVAHAQRILDAAAELFYREGIKRHRRRNDSRPNHQSPNETLYQHFPSKTAVVEEYLRSIEQTRR